MLLCTIVENGANTRFCRESGECRDYAFFLSFFYSDIYSEKLNFGRILAEILPKKLAAGGSGGETLNMLVIKGHFYLDKSSLLFG